MIARRVFAVFGFSLVLGSGAVARAQDAAEDDAGMPPTAPTETNKTSQNSGSNDEESEDAAPPPKAARRAAPASEPVSPPEEKPAPAPFEGITMAPGMPDFGGEVTDEVPSGSMTGDGYHFDFHGYARAPLRIGYGPKADGTSGKELHAPQRSADISYTDWDYTNTNPGPWTELLFSYGNSRASVTTSIAAYNQTVAGWRDLETQLGINQAFVTLNFPDAFGKSGGLRGVFGSFTNRYGAPGKFGGGMYDTYLFGRTRAVGETLTADFPLSRGLTLVLEQGFGAKIAAIPFQYYSSKTDPRPLGLPYPGPVPEGDTFLHHEHVALDIEHAVTLAGHYIYVWTPDDNSTSNQTVPLMGPAPTKSQPGHMAIYGGEARIDAAAFGDGYIGYSHVGASHIDTIADAIELLHSEGGYSFKSNFFNYPLANGAKNPDDSGTVDSVLFQYSLSLGKVARYPKKFGGNGPDFVLTPFGMFNKVKSANSDYSRFKFGLEGIYSALDVLAFGMRYDLVQPNLHDSRLSFSELSPKVVLRTSFVSHEAITLQYSHYIYGSHVTPGFPYDTSTVKPDPDVFMLSASMWW